MFARVAITPARLVVSTDYPPRADTGLSYFKAGKNERWRGKMGVLFNESPLTVNVELAKLIGLNESIVLQQIQYWLKINEKAGRNFRDGYYWTYNTFEEWQEQFPFWSLSTIKRIFAKLEKKKYIIIGNYNKLKIDRTKWYRINYELLETPAKPPKCQNDPMDVSKWPNGKCQNEPTITRDYPENTTEINSYKGFLPDGKTKTLDLPEYAGIYNVAEEDYEIVMYYIRTYYFFVSKDHPKLKAEQWHKVFKHIRYCDACDDELDNETLKIIIDKHLQTKYKNCDYNILHFLSDEIKNNRFYEVAY